MGRILFCRFNFLWIRSGGGVFGRSKLTLTAFCLIGSIDWLGISLERNPIFRVSYLLVLIGSVAESWSYVHYIMEGDLVIVFIVWFCVVVDEGCGTWVKGEG